MIDHVATLMAQLPEPTPPASLKANVMARIAREAELQQDITVEATDPARIPRERPVWIWTLAGGLAAVIGTSAYGWLVKGALPSLTAPLIGGGVPALVPMQGSAALIIGLGLLIYLAGLFAPLRPSSSPRSRAAGRSLTST
jgi:hypothetical protein